MSNKNTLASVAVTDIQDATQWYVKIIDLPADRARFESEFMHKQMSANLAVYDPSIFNAFNQQR